VRFSWGFLYERIHWEVFKKELMKERGNTVTEIMVSICCITYNQEKYISETLEGFLMQKTDFEYEILIHDDASTDQTAAIIKQYETKYPGIIKSIYQKTNQYSKGVKIDLTFNFPRAKGKYIALCEGDDYWTDVNKLQLQVEFMEKHANCSLCTHMAEKISNDLKNIGYIRPNVGDREYKTDDVIRGGGSAFATNSMMFPTKLVKELPDFYVKAPVGDYPLAIFLSLYGNVQYIDLCMSAYRVLSIGSWSSKLEANPEKKRTHNKRIETMLYEIDEFANYAYTQEIRNYIIKQEICLYMKNLIGQYIPFAGILWRKIKNIV
jgi:glycosyltransferase involved in cell wall biosynthesis